MLWKNRARFWRDLVPKNLRKLSKQNLRLFVLAENLFFKILPEKLIYSTDPLRTISVSPLESVFSLKNTLKIPQQGGFAEKGIEDNLLCSLVNCMSFIIFQYFSQKKNNVRITYSMIQCVVRYSWPHYGPDCKGGTLWILCENPSRSLWSKIFIF